MRALYISHLDRKKHVQKVRQLQQCHHASLQITLAKSIFHYIDGAADDEVTYRRNTEAFESADLIPNVLVALKILI